MAGEAHKCYCLMQARYNLWFLGKVSHSPGLVSSSVIFHFVVAVVFHKKTWSGQKCFWAVIQFACLNHRMWDNRARWNFKDHLMKMKIFRRWRNLAKCTSPQFSIFHAGIWSCIKYNWKNIYNSNKIYKIILTYEQKHMR